MRVDVAELDRYRRLYDDLTVAELAEWNERLVKKYPDQRHYNYEHVRQAVGDAGDVVELGGYDGSLADVILERNTHIRRWRNYELVRVKHAEPRDPRYELIVDRDRFAWRRADWDGDVLVLSHVLEHLNAEQALELVLTFPRYDRVYIDAPLRAGGWEGSTTAHVLGWTWDDLLRIIEAQGIFETTLLGRTLYDGAAYLLEAVI